MKLQLLIILVAIILLFLIILGVISYFFNSKLKLGSDAYGFHRYSQAEKYFRNAIFLTPFSSRAYLELGKSLLAQGKGDEAIKSFNKASSFGLDVSSFHANLGHAFFEMNDYANAEKEYMEALRLDPNNAAANNWLSLLMSERGGDQEDVIKFAQKATEINPNDIELLISLSDLYSYYGKYSEAIQVADRAIKARPKECQALTAKAHTLALSGKYSDAIEITDQVIKVNSNVGLNILDCLALAYVVQGEVLELKKLTPEAIFSYEKSAEIKDVWNNENLRRIKEKARQRIEFLKNPES